MLSHGTAAPPGDLDGVVRTPGVDDEDALAAAQRLDASLNDGGLVPHHQNRDHFYLITVHGIFRYLSVVILEGKYLHKIGHGADPIRCL